MKVSITTRIGYFALALVTLINLFNLLPFLGFGSEFYPFINWLGGAPFFMLLNLFIIIVLFLFREKQNMFSFFGLCLFSNFLFSLGLLIGIAFLLKNATGL